MLDSVDRISIPIIVAFIVFAVVVVCWGALSAHEYRLCVKEVLSECVADSPQCLADVELECKFKRRVGLR